MLICNETVGITHIAYNSDTGEDEEFTSTLSGVSWYGKYRASPDTGGMHGAAVYQCRIPEAAAQRLEIAPGDKITCGNVTATVTAVHDNRRGQNPHWYIEAQ